MPGALVVCRDAKELVAAKSELIEFLASRPVQENVLWGLLQRQLAGHIQLRAQQWVCARERGRIAGVMAVKPAAVATLSGMSHAHAHAMGQWLSKLESPPAKVQAPAALLQQLTQMPLGLRIEAEMLLLRVKRGQLRAAKALGLARKARRDERALVHGWLVAFCQELRSGLCAPGHDAVASWIESGRCVLWQSPAGDPVAMAIHNRSAKGGENIGFVYTDPCARGQGYAAAITYALSQSLLARTQFVCLFVLKEHPWTRRMYARLGFEAVDEIVVAAAK